MNACYESVAATPTPPPAISSPPPIVEWGATLGLVLAGLGYAGKIILQQWQARETSDSTLMSGVVKYTQEMNAQLLADSKENKQELIRHIDLSKNLTSLSASVKDDLQRALVGQAGMQQQSIENQVLIKQELQALHRRWDVFEVLMRQVLGGYQDENQR